MWGYNDKLRQIAARLLDEGTVDVVIGFKQGTVPLINAPCIVRDKADAAQLIWDGNCGLNLANYLTDRKERIGIIAKGCDARSINNHIIEGRITRAQLVIIGVPCRGMLDRHKLGALPVGEIITVAEEADAVVVQGRDGEQRLARADVLQANCAVCAHPNPVVYDELIDTPLDVPDNPARYAAVERIEAMDTPARWAFFEDLLATCTRCYACRNACPLCYCPTCFVDESDPQWVGKTDDPVDVRTFHFLRAFHCAGRCTDCGACVRACPMGIDVRAFTKKLEKDCLELWDWQAGLDAETRPALDTFRPDDPQDFIK